MRQKQLRFSVMKSVQRSGVQSSGRTDEDFSPGLRREVRLYLRAPLHGKGARPQVALLEGG
ncbi:MAG: hypothetical protein CVU57_08120 [Deltaproteobacteria bacterium HGW-Deltaproteobacteria-15]|nr:MAG: hypothetical protein CVU57_08120 [Deltaproteobacteria bacterium HGW-Deltaproteobacteria-15]